jgi:LmbE family N-acetylglucosaminyl deacetylase
MTADSTLRVLVLVAHPDDAEVRAGGLASIYRELGHTVRIVAVTDGGAGHHIQSREEVVARRRLEAEAACAVIGSECEVWDNPDGELQPTLEFRSQVIREIRRFQPDLVLTHRPEDYHPDHRALGEIVRDASYMVTVPRVCPDTPHLRKDPVVAYVWDEFTRPTELRGDVVVDITDKVGTIARMLACHESQLFEWLPYNWRIEEEVPEGKQERVAWARGLYEKRAGSNTERYRERLIETYGPERGAQIRFAEIYEISEYASPLTEEERRRLFPFVPCATP